MLCHWQSATLTRYSQALTKPLQLGPLQISHRQGLYLDIRFSDGRLGRGEIAPLPGFSEENLAQAEQQITDCLQGHTQRKLYPSVAFGLDCAMAGLPPESPIKVAYPLLAGDLADCQQVLNAGQFTLAKLKVARHSPKHDIELIQQLQQQYPSLTLRLDANQGWIWNQAVFVLESIDLSRIEYVEEPLNNSRQCAMLAARTQVGIALDETLQDSTYRYHYFEGLRCLVIKPSLVGSWHRMINLIEQASANQVKCVLSSACETETGLAWIQTLARQYTPNEAPGLDTFKAFANLPREIELIQEFKHCR